MKLYVKNVRTTQVAFTANSVLRGILVRPKEAGHALVRLLYLLQLWFQITSEFSGYMHTHTCNNIVVCFSECNCNGYDADCNRMNGVCTCFDVGVVGPHCNVCNVNNSYVGDADNFCFCKSQLNCLQLSPKHSSICLSSPPSLRTDQMSVGFVYTFGVTESREKESFYMTVPQDDVPLRFEFDITSNPNGQDVIVQLFLGKGK